MMNTTFGIINLTTFESPNVALCRGKIPTFGFWDKVPIIRRILLSPKGEHPNKLIQGMWWN